MQKSNKLYNLIFPIWLLCVIPITWVVIIPANFIIDLTVIALTLKYLKVSNIKQIAKATIFKVWIAGFVSDFVGTAFMLLSTLIISDSSTPLGMWWHKNIASAVSYAPFSSIYSVVWITVCVVIAAVLIYFLNYKLSFKKIDLPKEIKHKLALSLAVFTAPYLFFLPTNWFF